MALARGVIVHRLRIHADRGGAAIDVALPSNVPVTELLPAILGLVDGGPVPSGTVTGWRLDRPVGGTLVESLSLSDNAVDDGELLLLTTEFEPPFGLLWTEPCQEVAATGEPQGSPGVLPGTACVLGVALVAVALVWADATTPSLVNPIVAAAGACAAVVATVTAGHSVTLGLVAVILAATTGFLAVPSGPGIPNAFLAAAAAAATSMLLLRLAGRSTPAFVATATGSALVAIATVTTMPLALVGTVLTIASLGLVTLAPRIAVLTTGLATEHRTDGLTARAATGHATLTGLVIGCAAGATAGAALVGQVGLRGGAALPATVAFAAVVGLLLLLRARIHADRPRRVAFAAAGLISVGTSFAIVAAGYPDRAGWVCGAAIGVALLSSRSWQLGAGGSRLLDRLEYAALAAVVPIALWVGGVYALVGTVHLP